MTTTTTTPQHDHRLPRRILGIDGGSRWIGWAVLDSGEPTYLGTMDCRDIQGSTRGLRKHVRREVTRLLADFRPEVVALEAPTNTVADSMRRFRLALREIEHAVRVSGAELIWCSPKKARLIVTGDGWATKESVARELARAFPKFRKWLLPRKTKEIARYVHHSSDALCCAIAVALEKGRALKQSRPAA